MILSDAVKSFVPFKDSPEYRERKRFSVIPQKPFAPCIHEGNVVTLCARGDDGHLRQCLNPDADWDNCRRSFGGPDEGDCSRCPLHSRHEIGNVRHLLYFICPISGNGVWQWNAEQLNRRIGLFNGKRVVAIATGNPIRRPGIRPRSLDPPEAVEAMLPGCEFLHFVNKPGLGEAVAWDDLWAKVLPGQPGDVTFYAHAKGVSRGPHTAVKRWTEVLYESNLDFWPYVQEQLRTYPLCGSLKKLGYGFAEQGIPGSRWHYSGTFYWVRNADWLARGGDKCEPHKMISEALPGLLFKPEEGGVLFHQDYGINLNTYNPQVWQRLEPIYQEWLAIRNQQGTIAVTLGETAMATDAWFTATFGLERINISMSAQMHRMRKEGMSVAEIAKLFKMTKARVFQILDKHGK